tara:strand:+ start:1634 stop:1762 length:129 start_codon:yes stop_codon:yes gene_type:complete
MKVNTGLFFSVGKMTGKILPMSKIFLLSDTNFCKIYLKAQLG